MTSQYFGDLFDIKKLKKSATHEIRIWIYSPEDIIYDPNVTLHIKFEQTKGLNYSVVDDYGNKIKFDSNNKVAYTPPDYKLHDFNIVGRIEEKDLEKMNFLVMPGFQFSWYYSGAEVTPDPDPFKSN